MNDPTDPKPLQFPNYQPPNPKGIPLAPHDKYGKPLLKMINRLAQKHRTEKAFKTTKRRTTKSTKRKKGKRFY